MTRKDTDSVVIYIIVHTILPVSSQRGSAKNTIARCTVRCGHKVVYLLHQSVLIAPDMHKTSHFAAPLPSSYIPTTVPAYPRTHTAYHNQPLAFTRASITIAGTSPLAPTNNPHSSHHLVHELLRDAADVDTGPPQAPRGSHSRGLDKVQTGHPLPQRRGLLGASQSARPAPNNHQVVVVLARTGAGPRGRRIRSVVATGTDGSGGRCGTAP